MNLGKEFDCEALLRMLTLVCIRAIAAEEPAADGPAGTVTVVRAVPTA